MSYTTAEVSFLVDNANTIDAIAPTISLAKKDAIHTASTLKQHFGDHARAVHELLTARASAHHHNKLPSHWLMCTDSSQQATPMAVAALRAHRIHTTMGTGTTAHDVTCSIGTEIAALTHAGIPTIGSDLDPARIAMAHYNLNHTPQQTPHQAPHQLAIADALTTTSTADIIIADPARRNGGRRITSPTDLIPPLPELINRHHNRALAIKCAPGLDFNDWEGLVSITSVDGGVKEACLYTPHLSDNLTREANIIKPWGQDTFTDRDPDDCGVSAPGRYLIDPDGAVVRAGLVRAFAHRYGLSQLDERIAYLTGQEIPAGYSGFEILDVANPKKVKAALAAHNIGSVEILLRGIDGDPDELRKKYKPKGKNPGAVVLTRIGSQGVALICGPRQHRERTSA
ncbi:class I SAM-dependent methyltransferase [Corynebacterium aquilae]|uniref:THUMP-like domain-containing protein n=1 Tax=Corynebacterium aquilae DSM 44791 TaxID=1431546 RepID=A0A1L7CFH2_9CORY|nr:hypothetical protein [Corynebacterium aquilae]APT84576.1 hypothetical protein CAQU_05310 [Corynebacterium aquilae DSM 44791]